MFVEKLIEIAVEYGADKSSRKLAGSAEIKWFVRNHDQKNYIPSFFTENSITGAILGHVRTFCHSPVTRHS